MIEIISIIMVLTGLVFFLGSIVGLVRFPDFYTRMHAAGKGDTLSTMFIIGGLGLYLMHDGVDLSKVLVTMKFAAICVFIMITSPTATHELMQAGHEDARNAASLKPAVDEKPAADPEAAARRKRAVRAKPKSKAEQKKIIKPTPKTKTKVKAKAKAKTPTKAPSKAAGKTKAKAPKKTGGKK